MKEKEDLLKHFIDEDEMNFEDYVDSMTQKETWGGYFELYCLSQALQINFIIVLKDLNVIKIIHFPQEKVRTFYLGFSEDEATCIPEHYSSLRLISDDTERPKNLEIKEPLFTKQIPLDSFKPILTNNEAKIHKDKLINAKDGILVVTNSKKKSRKERLEALSKKNKTDDLEEDEILSKN
jgi:hypothetical protein